MSLTIYHNPRCTKSRETLALLEERGLQPHVVEYLKAPPSAAEFKRVLGLLGLSPAQVLRRKEAQDAGIDPSGMSDDALIAAMVANPAVIERPIVINGGKAALGRPPESVLAIL